MQYTDRKEGDNDTRLYWWADNYNGDVLYDKGIQRSRQYDPRVRGWYKQTKAEMKQVWSSIYIFASSNQLGLTACEPVKDTDGNLLGVLAVDYTLGDIDKFLTDEFSAEGRAVYLVEKETGFLVGSSTLDPILRLVKEGELIDALQPDWNENGKQAKNVLERKYGETIYIGRKRKYHQLRKMVMRNRKGQVSLGSWEENAEEVKRKEMMKRKEMISFATRLGRRPLKILEHFYLRAGERDAGS